MPAWLKPLVNWLMPRVGPRGLEFARARVEMKAIESIPVDESGVEMTFTAIRGAAQEASIFRRAPRRNVMIVVFTDEVGNDQNEADKTAAFCRTLGIPVYVVGVPAPFGLHRFGRRRGWMLLVQPLLAASILGMALTEAALPTILAAGLIALFSATQDIAIDAWRIETFAEDYEQTERVGYGVRVTLPPMPVLGSVRISVDNFFADNNSFGSGTRALPGDFVTVQPPPYLYGPQGYGAASTGRLNSYTVSVSGGDQQDGLYWQFSKTQEATGYAGGSAEQGAAATLA
jgi:hypothetical protein